MKKLDNLTVLGTVGMGKTGASSYIIDSLIRKARTPHTNIKWLYEQAKENDKTNVISDLAYNELTEFIRFQEKLNKSIKDRYNRLKGQKAYHETITTLQRSDKELNNINYTIDVFEKLFVDIL